MQRYMQSCPLYILVRGAVFLRQRNRIQSMKNYYRSLAHLQHKQVVVGVEQTPSQMSELLDEKLHYINRSFKHNLQIQEIFLDVIKAKRTLHSKQIKAYYALFTENKADSQIFRNSMQQPRRQDLGPFLHIKEATRSLKRLYCRMIEKIMVKVAFYMMNRHDLAFMCKEVNELMKKCQLLMRRINCLKDLHSVNDTLQDIYSENERLQIRIIEELIDKGFIISVDEFYRINGVDLVSKELYERLDSDAEDLEQQSNQQQLQDKMQSINRFVLNTDINTDKKNSFQRMKKEEPDRKLKKKRHAHRMGCIDIQNKYRDLLVHLENLINNDLVEQITEEKGEIASQQSSSEKKNQEKQQAQAEEPQPPLQLQNQLTNQTTKLSLKLNQQTPQNNLVQPQNRIFQINQNKSIVQGRSGKKNSTESKNEASFFQCKSQLKQKIVTLESAESNSYTSDILNKRGRANYRKKSSQFFSKSFINAIKVMQKVNINDKTNRLAIKRMSQHIVAIHRQSENSSNAETHRTSNAANLNSVLRRNDEKRSIIKLINIYKNRKFEQEVQSIQRQFDEYRDKIINKVEVSPRPSHKKLSIFYQDKKEPNEINEAAHEKTSNNITNYPRIIESRQSLKILEGTESLNDFITPKIKQYQRTPALKNLFRRFKGLKQIQNTPQLLKNLDVLKAKMRLISNIRTPSFQNARLSHHMQGCMYRMQSLRNSPEKAELARLQGNSLLTSKGIQTIDYQRFKAFACEKKDKLKMYKTAVASPSMELSSRAGRFEVYDRKRRVMLQ